MQKVTTVLPGRMTVQLPRPTRQQRQLSMMRFRLLLRMTKQQRQQPRCPAGASGEKRAVRVYVTPARVARAEPRRAAAREATRDAVRGACPPSSLARARRPVGASAHVPLCTRALTVMEMGPAMPDADGGPRAGGGE